MLVSYTLNLSMPSRSVGVFLAEEFEQARIVVFQALGEEP